MFASWMISLQELVLQAVYQLLTNLSEAKVENMQVNQLERI